MKSRSFRLLLVVVLAVGLGLVGAAFAPSAPQVVANKALAVQALELKGLTLQARLQMVGKSQVIRGYYSDKSVPLIVDDINRMMVREPLPPGSYVLLAGAIPSGVRFGDRLEVKGVIVRPTAADPVHLRGEQTILRLSDKAEAVKVLKRAAFPPVRAVSLQMTQQLITASSKFRIKIKPGVFQIKTDYAVLINGGINWANYWVSFYNDLVVDYNMLLGRGYLPANITVLNADGSGAPPGTTPCGNIPVNYAATAANVTTVFNQLAAKMKAQDTLCVMITNHGGTGVICLWGENMSGATFGGLVSAINNYSQMTFSFDLCHAAGLISNVRGVNRLIFAACDADKSAYDSSHGHYGALNYALIAALTGMAPAGGAVNADENGDGQISLAEAFDYVRIHIDSGGSQTPHYNDDTTPPDATLHLPQGTDGILGANRYL